MRNIKRLLLIILLICTGCGMVYTEEQVNETVVAKIKEVAGLQKINVTVETVVVEKYIVVTATPEPSASPFPILPATVTPLGFERTQAEDVFTALTNAKFTIRRFYYEPGQDEIGTMTDLASTVSKFTLGDAPLEYDGYIYSFSSQAAFDQGFNYLTSHKPDTTNQTIFQKSNLLIELDADTPSSVLDRVRSAIEIIR